MKLLAIDSNSILNRAFYGVKPLTSKDGTPTNAIYGFFNIFLRLCEETAPDAVAFAFDMKAPTFRHRMFDGYKAQRKPMPEELFVQFSAIRPIITALGYRIIECEGFEADDILGTLGAKCRENGDECIIATGDRDSMQLVGDGVFVKLAYTKNGMPQSELFDAAAVKEKYGVTPDEIVDMKAIMGDTSDNIPGVPGIGEKGAAALISEFSNLETIYENINSPSIKDSVRAKLIAGKDSAFLSRTLARIVTDAPVGELADYITGNCDRAEAKRLLARLDMFKLISRLGLSDEVMPAAETGEKTDFAKLTEESFDDVLAEVNGKGFADILPETENGEIKRVAVTTDGKFCVFSAEEKGFEDFFVALLSSEVKKRADNSKELFRYAINHGFEIKNMDFDLTLAGYLLSSTSSSYKLDELAASYGMPFPTGEDAFSNGAAVFSALSSRLYEKINEYGMGSLLRDIEIPLAQTLAAMENYGFSLDEKGLSEYGKELSAEINELQKSIFLLAGKEFNINSPKQLGEILFDVLGLPAKKKTKSGYSTNAETLEGLRKYHPIIDLLLRYRKLTKLSSTYVDGLSAACINGKIHTTFIQTETRTGRISSVEPNLQNIPVRSEEGSKMRKFFLPSENFLLVDADYSQIELRILAHVANDSAMRMSFLTGEDIHTQTAAQVFKVPEEFVTPQMRSRAKAVNFGIVYGIGAFSLANDIGVSRAEADKYIKNYLECYSGVNDYMDLSVENAKKDGFVSTIFGRRRYLPEITAQNHVTRAFGERVARNAPIQGSAADIIKIAMIRVFRRLKAEGLRARLLLQVHDELIVEAPPEEIQTVTDILKEEMSGAASLSVPLEVHVGVGENWLDAK